MNLFDALVEKALSSQPQLGALRPVVEKEILHHDLLREMNAAGFLSDLTFIGGTCLRACYGSDRLSEDLDFTGGENFDRVTLADLGSVLARGLHEKYGLEVRVNEPVKEVGNVDTWKITMITRAERPDLPVQRINIDICSIRSRDRKPAMLKNHYRIDMGTSGMIIMAESKEEILADKILALALRPNRIKNRDLWDILWLTQQSVAASRELVQNKLADRRVDPVQFNKLLEARIAALPNGKADYLHEIHRFLPTNVADRTISQKEYWPFLINLIQDITKAL